MVQADFYLQTHATNPFLKPETVAGAIDAFLGKFPHFCDSLFSVTQRQTRFYDQLGRAINHNPDMLARTQDLPPGKKNHLSNIKTHSTTNGERLL